jgi:hypothetical protein
MQGDDAMDEPALIERIRDRLSAIANGGALPAAPPRPQPAIDGSVQAIEAELETMAAASDVADVPLRSYRKVLGPLLGFARRIAQKLLAGPLERQASYNAANRRLAAAYRLELESLRRENQALQRTCEALESRLRQVEPGSHGA